MLYVPIYSKLQFSDINIEIPALDRKQLYSFNTCIMTEPIRGIEEIDDPYHRYQMSQMDVIKERTKVCITNLDAIANELKIPNKDLLISYINKSVSANFKPEKGKTKSKSQGRVSALGNIDCDRVRESIYGFIEYFVLCPGCRLPELSYRAKKNDVGIKCAACGHRGILRVDKTGQSTLKRMSAMIIENPSAAKKEIPVNPLISELDKLIDEEERERQQIGDFS